MNQRRVGGQTWKTGELTRSLTLVHMLSFSPSFLSVNFCPAGLDSENLSLCKERSSRLKALSFTCISPSSRRTKCARQDIHVTASPSYECGQLAHHISADQSENSLGPMSLRWRPKSHTPQITSTFCDLLCIEYDMLFTSAMILTGQLRMTWFDSFLCLSVVFFIFLMLVVHTQLWTEPNHLLCVCQYYKSYDFV